MKFCDFCGADTTEWSYPCQDFNVNAVAVDAVGNVETLEVLDSTSDWEACLTCAPYIDALDWHGLAHRCMSVARDGLYDQRLQLFQAFQHYRIGEKHRVSS